ncbi:MAG: hypothetical protein PHY02_09225 [Phycisphaerae bacterium]|nr:hypothetical protein [Phycisphaerae bacterium]
MKKTDKARPYRPYADMLLLQKHLGRLAYILRNSPNKNKRIEKDVKDFIERLNSGIESIDFWYLNLAGYKHLGVLEQKTLKVCNSLLTNIVPRARLFDVLGLPNTKERYNDIIDTIDKIFAGKTQKDTAPDQKKDAEAKETSGKAEETGGNATTAKEWGIKTFFKNIIEKGWQIFTKSFWDSFFENWGSK